MLLYQLIEKTDNQLQFLLQDGKENHMSKKVKRNILIVYYVLFMLHRLTFPIAYLIILSEDTTYKYGEGLSRCTSISRFFDLLLLSVSVPR